VHCAATSRHAPTANSRALDGTIATCPTSPAYALVSEFQLGVRGIAAEALPIESVAPDLAHRRGLSWDRVMMNSLRLTVPAACNEIGGWEMPSASVLLCALHAPASAAAAQGIGRTPTFEGRSLPLGPIGDPSAYRHACILYPQYLTSKHHRHTIGDPHQSTAAVQDPAFHAPLLHGAAALVRGKCGRQGHSGTDVKQHWMIATSLGLPAKHSVPACSCICRRT